jgi:hypothetical protein
LGLRPVAIGVSLFSSPELESRWNKDQIFLNLPWKGIPYFIEFNTGLSRKAVNEGTELAFDLEERENIYFGK